MLSISRKSFKTFHEAEKMAMTMCKAKIVYKTNLGLSKMFFTTQFHVKIKIHKMRRWVCTFDWYWTPPHLQPAWQWARCHRPTRRPAGRGTRCGTSARERHKARCHTVETTGAHVHGAGTWWPVRNQWSLGCLRKIHQKQINILLKGHFLSIPSTKSP